MSSVSRSKHSGSFSQIGVHKSVDQPIQTPVLAGNSIPGVRQGVNIDWPVRT